MSCQDLCLLTSCLFLTSCEGVLPRPCLASRDTYSEIRTPSSPPFSSSLDPSQRPQPHLPEDLLSPCLPSPVLLYTSALCLSSSFSNFMFNWMSTKSPVSVSMLALCEHLSRRKFSMSLELSHSLCLALRLMGEGTVLHLSWLAARDPETHPVCLPLTCAHHREQVPLEPPQPAGLRCAGHSAIHREWP